MPNIPYKSLEGYEPKPVLDAVIARRGGIDRLLNLDRMLLHSPPLAEGWAFFLSRVRTQFSLDAKLRELAICAVAVLNGADYEFQHHMPEWIKAGATPAQVAAVRSLDPDLTQLAHFDAAELAVLRLAIQMTKQVKVKPETLAAVRTVLPGDQQTVELVAVIGAYNMVSRILVATGVELE